MARAKRNFEHNENNNAIAYYRYSSSAQRDVSIEQQQEAALEYAKSHDLHIVREYADRAISGTRDDRPDFVRMLYEIEQLRPGYLILWKTDRLSRDRYDAVIAKKKLRDCGVKIVYVAETLPEEEAEQILIEGIYEAMAASFIFSHRKNVMRGLTDNANKALFNGVNLLGYKGEPNKKYEIDEETAPIVQRIYREYADGKPLKKIADELNEAGLTTIRNAPFTINSLRHILNNRSYLGEYHWGDVCIPNGMPKIIENELYAAVQEMMSRNKRGGKGEERKLKPDEIADFWLSNYIYCGLCGEKMHGVSGTSRHGYRCYYYSCNNKKKNHCHMKNIRKNTLEKYVIFLLKELLNDSALKMLIAEKCYEHFASSRKQSESYEKSLNAAMKEVDTKLNNIMKAIEAGIFNETTQRRMDELQDRKQQLKDELILEQNRRKYEVQKIDIIRFIDSFIGNLEDAAVRDKVLSFLINKIYVYEDKIVVVCFFTRDRREFSFANMDALLENREKIMSILDSNKVQCYTKEQEKVMRAMCYGSSEGAETEEAASFY